MAISTYLPIITLNLNGVNALIKRHGVTEWIKNKAHANATYEILLQTKRHTQTKSEEMTKDRSCKQ